MASGYSRVGDEGTGSSSSGSRPQRSYGTTAASPSVGFAQPERSGTEFFQICDKLTTNLFAINNATSTLERSLKQVGTPSDSQQLRDRISQINSSAGASVQEITGLLRSLQPFAKGNRQRRVQTDRLHNEFQATASRFAEIQKVVDQSDCGASVGNTKITDLVFADDAVIFAESLEVLVMALEALHEEAKPLGLEVSWLKTKVQKVVSTLRTARLPADMVAVEQDKDSASTTDTLIAAEQQKHAKMKQLEDLEFESAMHLEREQRVQRLESDIIDINEIMRDLSSMVTAQGDVVDSIEDNVEVAAGHVEEGREELIKAVRYQNKSRRKICICILILIIVLGIIGIIIGIHFSKKS
ncbi:Syntaxin-12 [Chionoecetes opilio]|uniref:Syntaxin-12 n=1 Tax=Chionoecetes opilio TaxID=41210 RepID=A0A8J4XSW2_CHIOP|nr:Syntaxin-12 [Chionoecetes opilio]